MHVDIKYLPAMVDEQGRTYLFVAIDRASRWGLPGAPPGEVEKGRQPSGRHVLDRVKGLSSYQSLCYHGTVRNGVRPCAPDCLVNLVLARR